MWEFLPPITPAALAALAAALMLVLLLLRGLSGPPAGPARRWSFRVIRLVIVLGLVLILVNPSRLDRTPGPLDRPEVMYLLDSSRSMATGSPQTRWDRALQIVRQSGKMVHDDVPLRPRLFRFGEQLAASEGGLSSALSVPSSGGQKEKDEEGKSGRQEERGASASPPRPLTHSPPLPSVPTDDDTRLARALRRLTGHFGRSAPESVVLLSDGRARDAAAVERTAAQFGRLGVPIHVVPVGDPGNVGGIAVHSVIVPRRVRRHSEVEARIFLRSFGYAGRTTEVRLCALDGEDEPSRQLAARPVTLQSGVQAVNLDFHSDLDTEDLEVSVPVQTDETGADNNRFTTDIEVDRTKIRVLYIEGNRRGLRRVVRRGRVQYRGRYGPLRWVLNKDPDIECVVLADVGSGRLRRVSGSASRLRHRHFPETLAELFAYDALILSNISREAFTDEQLERIDTWISERGAGLCMVGGPSSFASGGWKGTRVEDMVPVQLQDDNDWQAPIKAALRPAKKPPSHPVWNLVENAERNARILEQIPAVTGMNRFRRPRRDMAAVLGRATMPASGRRNGKAGGRSETRQESPPVLVAGRYGRGRTLALGIPITAPWAGKLVHRWGKGKKGDRRYYAKFWRNLVYWLTENSFIARRRLTLEVDKRSYRPGETISLRAAAYDENASPTTDYRVVATILPQTLLSELDSRNAPIHWPQNLPRDSQFGGEGKYVAWGEEFELPVDDPKSAPGNYSIELNIADAEQFSSAGRALRVEATAYEGYAHIDSTSVKLQIVHDPFEKRNPLPDHGLLHTVASASGGRVLENADALATALRELPVGRGESTTRRVPLWNEWWLLATLVGLLSVEWFWRRTVGLT